MTRTRILFVCHGNICRSIMAQCVMQHLVDEVGLSHAFEIDSAATTNEEIGNPIYPPARKKLIAEGIPLIAHRARRITRSEAPSWDLIVCMDEENMWHLRRILDNEDMARVCKLLSFVGETGDVADPWYTDNFDATFYDVMRGCRALLASLTG